MRVGFAPSFRGMTGASMRSLTSPSRGLGINNQQPTNNITGLSPLSYFGFGRSIYLAWGSAIDAVNQQQGQRLNTLA